MHKKLTTLFISLFLVSFLGACSKGSSATATPASINAGGAFQGNYESNNGLDEGRMTLDIREGTDMSLTGLLTIDPDTTTCITSGDVTGTVGGFSVNLDIVQADGGILNMALALSGNQLAGTYTVTGASEEGCSSQTGTGRVTFNR